MLGPVPVTVCTLATAMQADLWFAESESFGHGVLTMVYVILLTIFVVTPLTLLIGCFYRPLGDRLNRVLWCVTAARVCVRVARSVVVAVHAPPTVVHAWVISARCHCWCGHQGLP